MMLMVEFVKFMHDNNLRLSKNIIKKLNIFWIFLYFSETFFKMFFIPIFRTQKIKTFSCQN